jgi:hypothetical protein
MQTPGPGIRWAAPRLVALALLTYGVLVSTPDTLANAYPDTSTAAAPVCSGGAPATVFIDAGTVTNTTTLDLSADGGTAIGDASGGDDNLATTGKSDKDDKKHRNDGSRNDKNDKHRKDNDKDKDNDKEKDKTETAAAGNGGVSDASADGGAIAVEDVNSGGNVGSAIAVGDTVGGGYDACGNAIPAVLIDGGAVTNETIIEISADGGTAIADASGGDGNIASAGGSAGNGGAITSSAGNGGVANASADGGAISIGDINSGGNAGNAIGVGDTIAAPGPICCEPPPYRPVPDKPDYASPPGKTRTTPGKVVVIRLPDTGSGSLPASSSATTIPITVLMTLAAGMASVATRRRMA